jgi:hypothetical protein
VAVSKVKSVATRRFWALYQVLPSEVQSIATSRITIYGDGILVTLRSMSGVCKGATIGSPFA